jgi:hypothetical protein
MDRTICIFYNYYYSTFISNSCAHHHLSMEFYLILNQIGDCVLNHSCRIQHQKDVKENPHHQQHSIDDDDATSTSSPTSADIIADRCYKLISKQNIVDNCKVPVIKDDTVSRI